MLPAQPNAAQDYIASVVEGDVVGREKGHEKMPGSQQKMPEDACILKTANKASPHPSYQSPYISLVCMGNHNLSIFNLQRT